MGRLNGSIDGRLGWRFRHIHSCGFVLVDIAIKVRIGLNRQAGPQGNKKRNK